MYKVLKDTRDIGKLTPRVAFQLFDSLVLPILEYGGELLNKECKELERVQLKFLKIILGVSSRTSNLGVYGETGRFPLILRRQIKSVKYFVKIIQSPPDSLIRKVYNILLTLNNGGFTNWVTPVHKMLDDVNMLNNCAPLLFHPSFIQQFSVSI